MENEQIVAEEYDYEELPKEEKTNNVPVKVANYWLQIAAVLSGKQLTLPNFG